MLMNHKIDSSNCCLFLDELRIKMRPLSFEYNLSSLWEVESDSRAVHVFVHEVFRDMIYTYYLISGVKKSFTCKIFSVSLRPKTQCLFATLCSIAASEIPWSKVLNTRISKVYSSLCVCMSCCRHCWTWVALTLAWGQQPTTCCVPSPRLLTSR